MSKLSPAAAIWAGVALTPFCCAPFKSNFMVEIEVPILKFGTTTSLKPNCQFPCWLKPLKESKFREAGLRIDDCHVNRAGNNKTAIPVAEKKTLVIKDHIERFDFSEVYMYDDAKSNLELFLELNIEYPNGSFT